MNPDYSHLYRAFGLQPGCSIDAFRQAYRRHMASQHPDKAMPGHPRADDASLPLPELVALYDQAMRFHRRYGRLPGATPMAHNPAQDEATPESPAQARGVLSVAAADGHDRPPPATGSRWLLLLVVLALVLLAVGELPTPSRLEPARQADSDVPPPLSKARTLPDTLALGMDRSTVLAIQGEPVNRRDDEWEYGPSWVRFEQGRLTDWYSSPFYRLKTATPVPRDDPDR